MFNAIGCYNPRPSTASAAHYLLS
ncbi:23S rRNA (uracil-5-)-methyltransferase RumB, partial [Yersinia pestis PY-29]